MIKLIMKKAIFVLLVAILMGICGKPDSVEAGRQDGDTIYQVSLLQGLTSTLPSPAAL